MTFTEDCPGGRSQDLTCVSEDMVILPRKTFEEIYGLIGNCVEMYRWLQSANGTTFLVLAKAKSGKCNG
jgi:hypothetical protein